MLVERGALGSKELVGRRVFVGEFVMLGLTESLDGKAVVGRAEKDGRKLSVGDVVGSRDIVGKGVVGRSVGRDVGPRVGVASHVGAPVVG